MRLVVELPKVAGTAQSAPTGFLRGLRPILRQRLVAVDIGQGDDEAPWVANEAGLNGQDFANLAFGTAAYPLCVAVQVPAGVDQNSGRCAYGVLRCCCCDEAAPLPT